MTIRSNPASAAAAGTPRALQTRNQTNPEYNHCEYISPDAYTRSLPKQEHAYLQAQLSEGTYIHAPKPDNIYHLKPAAQRVAAYMQIIDDSL